jgi:hypothetical protein
MCPDAYREALMRDVRRRANPEEDGPQTGADRMAEGAGASGAQPRHPGGDGRQLYLTLGSSTA